MRSLYAGVSFFRCSAAKEIRMGDLSILSEYIKQFGAIVGIADLALDANGVLSLDVDGVPYGLHHFPKGNEVYITSRLGSLPDDQHSREAMFRFLLGKNAFFSGVGPGVVGLASDGAAIYYTARTRLEGLQYADFEEFFLAVVTVCATLRQEMAHLNTLPAPSGSGMEYMLRI